MLVLLLYQPKEKEGQAFQFGFNKSLEVCKTNTSMLDKHNSKIATKIGNLQAENKGEAYF